MTDNLNQRVLEILSVLEEGDKAPEKPVQERKLFQLGLSASPTSSQRVLGPKSPVTQKRVLELRSPLTPVSGTRSPGTPGTPGTPAQERVLGVRSPEQERVLARLRSPSLSSAQGPWEQRSTTSPVPKP